MSRSAHEVELTLALAEVFASAHTIITGALGAPEPASDEPLWMAWLPGEDRPVYIQLRADPVGVWLNDPRGIYRSSRCTYIPLGTERSLDYLKSEIIALVEYRDRSERGV